MKNNCISTAQSVRLMGAVSVLILFAATASSHSEGRWNQGPFSELVGTWKVQVTTYNCATGVTNKPFESLLTFAAQGTLTGTTNNPAFLPGQRSSEQGFWRPLGEKYFFSTTEAFIEFSSEARGPVPPFSRGSQRIEQGLEITGEDSFTSEATLTFFDESQTVVLTGCAKTTAQRLRP